MGKKITRVLALLLLGFLFIDSVQDAMAFHDDASGVESAICHTCVCGPHLTSSAGSVTAVPLTSVPYLPFNPPFYEQVFVKSCFHPPKTNA